METNHQIKKWRFLCGFGNINDRRKQKVLFEIKDYKEIDEYGERSNIIYFETNCDSYESRFLTDIYFEDHMGKGKSKILNEVGDWIIPKDGSVGQNFIKVVCSLKK